MSVENEVDRMLRLLREKIREQGYTQLKVQEALGWGRTYISQLLRKQKSLRFDQILQILQVIELDAGEFFAEFYHRELFDRYRRGYASAMAFERGADGEESAELTRLKSTVGALERLLVEQRVITREDLETARREMASGEDDDLAAAS